MGQAEIDQIQSKLLAIADEARTAFGNLTSAQLNWKPGPDRWSVAQCLDHLITTNKSYDPVMKKILNGDTSKTFWERLPLLPSLWARLFIKSLDPKSTRKLKAPKTFEPSQSDIEATIVEEFAGHQQELVQQIKVTTGKRPDQIVITSPAAKFITYSLLDAYRILVVHEQRHLEQAKRVLAEAAFPH